MPTKARSAARALARTRATGGVVQESPSGLPVPRHARRGQEHGLPPEEVGEPSRELRRVEAPAGVDDGADPNFAGDDGLVIIRGGFHDHRLPQPVALFQLFFHVIVESHERLHDCAHHAYFPGFVEEALDFLA